jgi:hypothetical protein
MSLNIQRYLGQIQSALDGINAFRGAAITVTTYSNVASGNRHRVLLDSIRNDLYHFDEEKKVRIIYNIGKYLAANTTEDPELIAVLQRVLQIMQRFQQNNEILVSPTKITTNSQYETSTPSLSNPVVRKILFDELDSLRQ